MTPVRYPHGVVSSKHSLRAGSNTFPLKSLKPLIFSFLFFLNIFKIIKLYGHIPIKEILSTQSKHRDTYWLLHWSLSIPPCEATSSSCGFQSTWKYPPNQNKNVGKCVCVCARRLIKLRADGFQIVPEQIIQYQHFPNWFPLLLCQTFGIRLLSCSNPCFYR